MSLAGLTIDLEALERLSPAEREAAEEQIRLLERQVKRNPLLTYNNPQLSSKPLHRPQLRFHGPRSDGSWLPARFFFGGNRSGKTTGGMVDTIIQAIDEDWVPEHLRSYKRWEPPFKCRIMTPDFGQTYQVVLDKIREWCPREQLKGNSFDRALDKQDRVLWFKNMSRLHFNSNVQDREQLGGSDLHRILYDEEPRHDLRNEGIARLIDHDGEEIFCMTPLEGMSWLYEEIYEPWEKQLGGRPQPETEEEWEAAERLLDMRVVVVDMDENPHLSESGKQRALAAYTGPEREARKSGRFVSFAGVIYPAWNEGVHVVPDSSIFREVDEPDDSPLPLNVECFEGIDPGMRHMAAVLFAYLDENDRMVVYDELALQGMTVAEVAKAIRMKRAEWKVHPAWTVIDPAARTKSPQTGRSDQVEYSDNGIDTIPGQNDVRAGINRVTERLEADPPRLVVAARCTVFRSQIKKYRWQRDTHRTENAPPERPVKKDDHLPDVVRYICMQRPIAPDVIVPPENETTRQRWLRHHLQKVQSKPVHDNGFGPGIFS